MPKATYLKMPLMVVTRDEVKVRIGKARKRSRRRLNARTMGKPVLKAKTKIRGGGSLPAPLRRRRVFCRVLDPAEWGLLFPDIPSEYGGTVCIRK